MPLRFKAGLYPVGGRYFIDSDGVKHKAENFDILAVRVAAYRKRNNLPPGDPLNEIHAQVCARQPEGCAETNPQPVVTAPPQSASSMRLPVGDLTNRVTKWFAHLLGMKRRGEIGKVSIDEARRRAAICAGCPLQRDVSSACGACKASRRAASDAILEGSKRVNSKLKACQALGEDTGLAVHLNLGPTGNGSLPDHCWRR
jgi:hypothetical protein